VPRSGARVSSAYRYDFNSRRNECRSCVVAVLRSADGALKRKRLRGSSSGSASRARARPRISSTGSRRRRRDDLLQALAMRRFRPPAAILFRNSMNCSCTFLDLRAASCWSRLSRTSASRHVPKPFARLRQQGVGICVFGWLEKEFKQLVSGGHTAGLLAVFVQNLASLRLGDEFVAACFERRE
jgi:hypothetical protein